MTDDELEERMAQEMGGGRHQKVVQRSPDRKLKSRQ
jgi:hypothetical protein